MSQSHKDLFTDIYILPNISKLIKNWRDFRCIIVEVSLDRLTRIVDDFIVPNLTNLFRFKRADWESHYGDSYYSVDPIEQITETKEFPRKKEILAKLRIEKNIRETRSAEQMREILDKIAPEDRVLYLGSIPIEKLIRITQNSKDFVYIARQISIEQFVELLAQADRYKNKLIITSDTLVAIDELSVHRPDIKEQVFKLFINNLNDGSIYDEHTARNLAKLMSMLSPELLELFLNKLAYLITEPMCLVQFLSETKSESIADLLTKLHAVLPLMRDSTLIPALKAELQPKAPLVIYDLIKFLESKRESESSVAIDVPGVQPVLIRLRLA
jgi:predicted nucleic acid-binding protein